MLTRLGFARTTVAGSLGRPLPWATRAASAAAAGEPKPAPVKPRRGRPPKASSEPKRPGRPPKAGVEPRRRGGSQTASTETKRQGRTTPAEKEAARRKGSPATGPKTTTRGRQRRQSSKSQPGSSRLVEELVKMGVGRPSGRKGAASSGKAIDRRRVNIVSEKLCEDIVDYIGPSLERHHGCDLVDLNPGTGLWSSQLHDFLRPRKHIMMDIDADVYQPFLRNLLAKENVEMIPKPGIVWKHLFDMLDTSLTHQPLADRDASPQRNDTLLVTANLSTFPKQMYHGFQGIGTMVMYQFMTSIRMRSLFQRYGLVRMLLWVNDEDKRRVVPRSLHRRRRGAFEAELSCEWIHEVAGADAPANDAFGVRDENLNIESLCNTLDRMEANGQAMPEGRETAAYRQYAGERALRGKRLAGTNRPILLRPFVQEIPDLEKREEGGDETGKERLKHLRSRAKIANRGIDIYHELLREFETLQELAKTAPADEFARADRAWNERVDSLNKNQRKEFLNITSHHHAFRQETPLLLWDRRAYEPLVARPDEVFPRTPVALLDIQPKPMRPTLLEHGEHSTRAGDISEAMLRAWFSATSTPVSRSLHNLWAGFDSMAGACPSLTDPARGGLPMTGWGELPGGCVNEQQWAEIMDAWLEWPFRPRYEQVLGRMMDEDEDEDETETQPPAMGSP